MSGNNEKIDNKQNLKCSRCGSTEYHYVTYGYSTDVVDVKIESFYSDGFEGTDGEDWECHECGAPASYEVKDFLRDSDWYAWG